MSGFQISGASSPLGASPSPTLQRVSKTVTFTGAAGLGAVGNLPLFTLTGQVLLQAVVPFGVTTLVGAAATIALGVAGSTSLLIAATVATTITTGLYWLTTTPIIGLAVPALLTNVAINASIVGTIAVAAITGGVLRVDVLYLPLSADGALS